jgi:peptidoglycan/LPS O-acetylase OafA/YrhL
MQKRLDVQGLRALAILLVVAYHGRFGVGGGFIGVDVFFVISGFVITGTLLRELDRTGTISIPGFYVRRVKRILPALAAMVAVVVVAGLVLTPVGATRIGPLTGAAAAVFGANWYVNSLAQGYFSVDSALNPLLHTWSLGVEEQFYLLYPVVLLVSWRLGGRLRSARPLAVVTVAALTAGSFLLAHAWDVERARLAFYGSPTRAWEFGLGALTALLGPLWVRLPGLACSALAAACFPLLLVCGLGCGAGDSLLVRLVVPVLATVGLIVAGFRQNVISSLLSSRPATALGGVSYSLYLWHWPLIVFALAVGSAWPWAARAAAVLAIVPAFVSYRWLENPIRRSSVSGRRAAALAAACVGVPATAALGATSMSLITPALYAPAWHADVLRGCDNAAPLGDPTRRKCLFGKPRRGSVVLIGDSNAGQFTEPVSRAARRLGYATDVVTMSSCPFVPLRFETIPNPAACRAHNARSLAALERLRPSLVIVAGRTDAWLNGRSHVIGTAGGGATSSPAVKARLYERALRAEATQLGRRGIPLVVVHPVPLLKSDQPGCAVVLLLVGRCRGAVSRAAAAAELAPAVAAERGALAGLSGAWLLDFEDALCSPAACSARKNGVATYRNVNHLSVPGSLLLTRRFEAEIRAHARPDRREAAGVG